MSMLRISLAVTVLLAACSHAKAGLVSITNAALSANGAEILGTGTQIHGWNVNGNEGGSHNVNGAVFTDPKPAAITATSLPATVVDAAGNAVHYSTPEMDEIMEDLIASNNLTSGSITIGSLSVGQKYRVQMLHHQDIDSNGQRQMELHFGTAAGTGSGAFQMGDNVGRITTTIFTADATSQLFTLRSSGSSGGNNRVILNGVSMFALPSTIALSAPVDATVIRGGNANVGVSIANSAASGFNDLSYSLAATGGGTLTITGTPDAGVLAPGASAVAQTANVLTNGGTTPLGPNTITFTATDSNASNSGANLAATLTVLDHADAEFVSPTGTNTLDLDFGSIAQGTGTYSLQYQIQNLLDTYRAGLDLDTINEVSDPSGVYTTNAAAFTNLATGSASSFFDVFFDSNTLLGSHTAQYTFNLSDQDGLSGSTGGQTLTLNVSAVVVPEPSSLAMMLFGSMILWLVRGKRSV